MTSLSGHIYSILEVNPNNFDEVALKLFRHQAKNNKTYSQYIQALGVNPEKIDRITGIPFLPIEFFKSHSIKTGDFEPEIVFTSSGTTGMTTSKHPVARLSEYEAVFNSAFESIYGPVRDYCVLALLPSYLERSGSSLIYMAENFIQQSRDADSGFFLRNHDELKEILFRKQESQTKTLLLGVTFALLDLAELYPMNLSSITIMETGGMKGRRKEMIREEVHQILKDAFHTNKIHSEYGMTELMSQAYSTGGEVFRTPPWMRVLVRDTDDPLAVNTSGKGVLNIIDLANHHSCAFIATSDVGIVYTNHTFEVQGRMDHADIRGCNLMVM